MVVALVVFRWGAQSSRRLQLQGDVAQLIGLAPLTRQNQANQPALLSLQPVSHGRIKRRLQSCEYPSIPQFLNPFGLKTRSVAN